MSTNKKFPKIFRALAGIQLIFTVALVTLVIAGLKDPKSIALLGLFEYPFMIFAALWSLINVFLWFFAFKGAYHFLYSSGINFVLICLVSASFFFRQYEFKGFEEDLIFGAIVSGTFLLYGITLVFYLFRKKLRDWTSTAFSWQHLGMYALVLLIAGLSTPNFHKLYDYNSWKAEMMLQYDYFLDIKNAIARNDKRAIGAAIRSGRYDPNLLLEDGNLTLLEYLMREYDNRNWSDRIVKHPDLSLETRVMAFKGIFKGLVTSSNEQWYIDHADKKIKFGYHAKPILDLVKEIPDDWANGMKFTLDEASYIIEAEGTVMLVRGGSWVALGTQKNVELLKKPEYDDIIKSVEGKELVVYVRRRSPNGFSRNVEVYQDPFETLSKGINWDKKRLFSARYNGSYTFDGSLEFPEDLRILSSKLDIVADYGKYLSWVENNLSDFTTEPVTVPSQYHDFLEGQTHLIPIAIERNIENGVDLILFRWQGDHNPQVVSFYYDAIAYRDQEIIAREEILRQGFYESPPDRFSASIEENRIKVSRKGYTASIMGKVIEETVYPDSTYYFSVSETGEIIPPDYLLPFVAGAYDYGRVFLAVADDYISGYYNNGQYEGNPNFGCSFLFYGSHSDLIHKRKINITTINPFQLSRSPKPGTLALHTEEDDLLTIEVDGSWDDCWDQNTGWAEMKGSFELLNVNSYREVLLVTEEAAVYDERDKKTKRRLQQDEVVVLISETEQRLKVIYFEEGNPAEGFIKKGRTRKLMS